MLKILFIANNKFNDYLPDAVFHGLLSMKNVEVTDYNNLWYMYDNAPKDIINKKFHGKGFAYYTLLPYNEVDRYNVEDKIKKKYYDLIVYGNIHRNKDLINIVFKNYEKNKIIVLDGEDETDILKEYVSKSIYFKREITEKNFELYPNIKPISFAYPNEKIVKEVPDKKKWLGQIIPGYFTTYIFNDETNYINDYRKSMFAFTWKKSGWDCLRHYEILCNGCMPLFIDIENCPKTICTTLPKDILIEYYKKSNLYDIFDMNGKFVYDKSNKIILNRDLNVISNLKINEDFYQLYYEYLNKLIEFSKLKLSTVELAKYVLSHTS